VRPAKGRHIGRPLQLPNCFHPDYDPERSHAEVDPLKIYLQLRLGNNKIEIL
jgi:hypothetical protein